MAKDTEIIIDKTLFRLSPNMRRGALPALEEIGDEVQKAAKQKEASAYTDRTGHLRRSILRQPVNKQELSVEVAATVGTPGNKKDPAYGLFINDGTKFIKPMHFLEKGKDKILPRMERILVKHLNRTM